MKSQIAKLLCSTCLKKFRKVIAERKRRERARHRQSLDKQEKIKYNSYKGRGKPRHKTAK